MFPWLPALSCSKRCGKGGVNSIRRLPALASSFFRDISGPGHLKSLLDALVHWAVVLVIGKGTVRFRAFSLGDFQPIAQAHRGDTEQLVVRLNAALDVSFQIIRCGDSARFQRAGKCAGQSTGERGDDVIDGGRQRLDVFRSIVFRIATVRTEMQRLGKPLDMRVAVWPLFLH
jgi:hypothetical protein